MSNSASLEAHARGVQERLTEQRRPYKPSTDAAATPNETVAAPKTADIPDAPSQRSSSATRASPQTKSRQDQGQPSQSGSFDDPLPSDVALAALKPESDSSPPSASHDSAESSGKQGRAQPSNRSTSGNALQSNDVATDSAADATTSSQEVPQEVPPPLRDSAQLQGRQPEAKPSPSSKQAAPKVAAQTAGQQRQSSSSGENGAPKLQSQDGRQDVSARPQTSFSEAVPAASTQQQAEPSSSSLPPPQSMSSSAGRGSARDKAAAADGVAEEPAASSSNTAKPETSPSKGDADKSSSTGGEPSVAPEAGQGAAGGDPGSEWEKLHDLITASSSTDDEVPAAFKTFDGNLPDEPEPDVTQKGPQLFQSAPKTDTSLPTPQGPQDSEGVHPKQDAAAQELESQPLRPVSEAAPAAGKSSTPDSAKDSQPVAVQPADSAASSSQAANVNEGGQEQAGEDAAQLRQRMQQLRQAMSDKQAALTAAESSTSQSSEKLQQQQQQQQPQAKQQASQTKQQQQPQAKQQASQTQQQQQQQDGKLQSANKQQQQPRQEPATPQPKDDLQQGMSQQQEGQEQQTDTDAKPARVLPRPSASSDAATIFLERADADGGLKSHPVKVDQLVEEAEEGVDLVALAAGDLSLLWNCTH